MEMIDKNSPTAKRIPVRFVDDERPESPAPAGDKSPDDLGRESAYEDETEMQRRIDRGPEADEGNADERDRAGGPRRSETPEHREDQDTNPRAMAAPEPEADEMEDVNMFDDDDDAFELDAATASLSQEAELLAAQDEVRVLEAELQKLRAERQELRELLARRQADFDNSRKRAERERNETYQRLVADVVKQLLPVVDNLQRALETEASVEANESEEFRHFLHGVGLIGKQLNGVLERLGVEVVPTTGRPFDPHVHEAIATEPSDEYAPDTVMQEIQRGYRLGDKLIRPAMVKVARK
jgi:molecular chaperone GrpE